MATGVVCVLFGSLGFIGQLISAISFSRAQRLGLQEKDDQTDPLYRRLELNAARWDIAVVWTLPAAGVLMLLDHTWWPHVALVAGGVWADAGGREMVKVLGQRSQGVRTGSGKEMRQAICFLAIMLLIGLWCVIYGLATVI